MTARPTAGVLAWLPALLLACGHAPASPTPAPTAGAADADARPLAVDARCAATCTRLRTLGCRAGEPSPRRGVPCDVLCTQALDIPEMAPPVDCIAAAPDRAALDATCHQRCVP